MFGAAMSGIALPARSRQVRVHRIGYLHPTDAEDVGYTAFRRALGDYGYVVGGNVVLVERFAQGHVERLPRMAEELVANHVDIIVAVSPTAIRAARSATRTIPIVMAFSGDDPVKSGFAVSLSRPGGNTTGLTTVALDIAPKWIELLVELRPGLDAVGVLRSPRRIDHDAQIAAMRVAVEQRRMRLRVAEVRGVEDYASAIATLAEAGSKAVVVLSGPEFTHNRVRLVELLNQHRLLSLFQFADFVQIGGLVSYGPDIASLSARAVVYVARILNGADPAALPIERPRKLLLVINRGTARALGLAVPPSLLLLADRVIQ